ncbi:methyltransferase family protein [Flavobacteriaceae bacterium MAR_2010_72]|nr:methyltransferase family protein [Flavobacteriaceae bacterium MAR_2010_72]TVZ58271.1 methyltransferase family protein [Flavobacteriaceae bacterium MAR_2010_105]
MEDYFKGEKLYGDDFSLDKITEWYKEEEEGYSKLESRELELLDKGIYLYENINRIHGFKYLNKNKTYKNVLGIGSATGHEFLPIIDKIENLYILEPSDKLQGQKIKDKRINYVKPEINGDLVFEDNFFDLVTSFGVLHHIPNASHVIKEINRVMNNNGVFLLREPIVSMGDWRQPRYGLTKNERGLPLQFLEKSINDLSFKIIRKNYCFTMSSFFSRFTQNILSKPIYAYKAYVIFDKYLSYMLKWNVKYHTENKFKRLYPQSVFLVLEKT